MAIADHINMLGVNPLTGVNDDDVGPRFPSLRDAYDPALRGLLRRCADELGIALPEGVYLAAHGPSFETPAEIRAFRTLGADAVGMSTVPEVILARHCGLRVAAVSAITNLAEGMGGDALSHEQTLRTRPPRRATSRGWSSASARRSRHDAPARRGDPPQARRGGAEQRGDRRSSSTGSRTAGCPTRRSARWRWRCSCAGWRPASGSP